VISALRVAPPAQQLTMKITVVICTYNRCVSLAKALESVAAQIVPESVEWDVLVVDNNSQDQTPAVVQDFCSRHPRRFHYLFESKPGLSHARNAALREVRSDVVVFTDDDVTAEPLWLQSLTQPLHDGKGAGVGGRVVPEWTCPPPAWLPVKERYGLAPLAMFDLGSEAGPLAEPPFGANMAFRRAMFDKYGLFRTDLGRRPGSLISNEDTEFGSRLLAAGERLRYEPSAVVHHLVTAERVQEKYFLAWSLAKGQADTRQSGIPTDARWYVAGIPLYLFRRLVMWTLRSMVATEPAVRFGSKRRIWTVFGQIKECYRLSHDAKRQA
jgi:glycosyltransferase involved in cell wall biosynthesis